MFKNIKNQALKLAMLQFGAAMGLAVLFLVFANWQAGWSCLLGSLSGVIPSLYFIWKFFSNSKRQPGQIIKDFFTGELVKIILGAIFLVLAVKFLSVSLVPLLCGYIGVYLSIWLAPLVI
jgi:ATP synthase protein I